MAEFAVRRRSCQFDYWLQRFATAAIILLLFQAPAKADPRIDPDTGPAPAASLPSGLSTASAPANPATIEQQGMASWYGRAWRGRKTANGSRFDERLLTAASLSLPFAARAHVVNLQNGRSVDVIVNDRGPYHGGRIIDLSQRAAAVLGMMQSGVAQVAIRVELASTARDG